MSSSPDDSTVIQRRKAREQNWPCLPRGSGDILFPGCHLEQKYLVMDCELMCMEEGK